MIWVTDSKLPEHSTLASLLWSQLCSPQGLLGHSLRKASFPVQFTLSSQMVPDPWPNRAPPMAFRAVPHSSSLHTTLASFKSQSASHTVPHCLLWYTSSLPAQRVGPSTSRSSDGTKEVSKVVYPPNTISTTLRGNIFTRGKQKYDVNFVHILKI